MSSSSFSGPTSSQDAAKLGFITFCTWSATATSTSSSCWGERNVNRHAGHRSLTLSKLCSWVFGFGFSSFLFCCYCFFFSSFLFCCCRCFLFCFVFSSFLFCCYRFLFLFFSFLFCCYCCFFSFFSSFLFCCYCCFFFSFFLPVLLLSLLFVLPSTSLNAACCCHSFLQLSMGGGGGG